MSYLFLKGTMRCKTPASFRSLQHLSCSPD